jgi:hypothetical protein
MKESKLIRHLQVLSPTEMNRFEKFVRSPYFNSHKETIHLVKLLRKAHPRFEPKQVEKKRIFRQIYPQATFSANKLAVLNKNLLQLLYAFLQWEEPKTDPEEQREPALLYLMSRRGLDAFIPRELQKAWDQLHSSPFRDTEFYYQSFRLSEFQAEFDFSQNQRSMTMDLGQVSDKLDHFYLAKKLKLACAIYSRKQFLAEAGEVALLEEIRAYCRDKEFADAPVVSLYAHLLDMLTEKDSGEAYHRLFAVLPQFVAILPKDEIQNVYVLLINYCNLRYKSGETEYLAEILAIYRQMLAHELVFELESVASAHFKNIATLGIKLAEYEWTEQFIHQYQERLPEKYRAGVMRYSLAYLAFVQQNYRQSMRELLMVEFIDGFHRMNYYILLLKTYYECDETEPLFSLCNTFGMYVRRNKQLSENNRKAYLALSRLARKLARYKYETNPSKLSRLQKEINNTQLLVERAWLQEKVNYLLSLTAAKP